MRRNSLLWAGGALLLCLTACVSPQQQASQKEDMLAAAGFQMKPADSPARAAAMKRLPANKFAIKVVNGNPIYLYADPLSCNCVYFGNQQNWDAYKKAVFIKNVVDEQQMTAMLNQEAWGDWWGPWGYYP